MITLSCIGILFALILIIVLLLCQLNKLSYRKANYEFFNNLKVAIVSTIKEPIDYDIWLNYHLNKMRFDKIYLKIEDTPQVKSMFNKYGDKISAKFINNVNDKNNYDTLQKRQTDFIEEVIKDCNKRGINFLLHIDDDELFMISSKYKDVKDLFVKLNIGKDIQNVHFDNVEAIFPKDMKHCFGTNKFLDCQSGGSCKSYANGKSAGKVSQNLRSNGPHYFSGKTKNISKKDAMILHFDSCNYDKWQQKFKNLANVDNKSFNNIPFKFYKDSIKLLQECKGGSCKRDGKKLWERNKVDPYYNESRGVIDVPLNL